MSVDYKSVLIYGFKTDPEKWSYEDTERMEDLGWDIVRDSYGNAFLYVGKIFSSVCSDEQGEIPKISLVDLIGLGADIIEDIPDNVLYTVKNSIPQLYHICYAT